MPTSRPNVLFVLTDQHQAQALGAVNDAFHTPALDDLASDGTLFTNAYCTHPQCSPSRSSLVTGKFPHQTGVRALSNWGPYELDPDSNSVGRTLSDAGYETLWAGRWDLGVENTSKLGWEFTRNLDVTGTDGPRSLQRDGATATEVARYVREYDGDEPFFATASFNLPHPPYFEDEAFSEYYDRDDISLPANHDDDLSTKPEFHRERADSEECDLTEAEFREIAYQYRTMVSHVDALIGELLDTLRAEGLYEDTVIVFTADHGDMQAAHGLNKKGVVAYDEILRVPLIVRHPGLESQRDVIPDLVSTAAVPGTIVEAAGKPVAEEFTGGSLLPAMRRETPPEEDRVFFEHNVAYWGHHPYRGVRTPRWKLVEYLKDDDGELYDLDADPGETTNLYGDPDYADVTDRLHADLEDWWAATDGDTDEWVSEPSLSFRA
ncbi:sulfatase family protein [Halobaculum sp. P14]|uniref:sulfatase family protein n=1 Tax=Halobaculum sp. P14 TaxID=3421638 RepID=UPI003EBD7456